MKEETDTRITVADNGRIWIDGEVEGIILAREKLTLMMEAAKVSGYGGDA